MTATGTTAYLGLGASVGDRWQNLRDALQRLETHNQEVQVARVSPIYESPHMGLTPGDETRYPAHLNCVAEIETTLAPNVLLHKLRAIEDLGGRRRTERWGPRTIDIDILLYGDLALRTETLTLPHPGIAERAFVLRPLFDLAPDLTLPDGRAIRDLLAQPAIQEQILTVCIDNALNL